MRLPLTPAFVTLVSIAATLAAAPVAAQRVAFASQPVVAAPSAAVIAPATAAPADTGIITPKGAFTFQPLGLLVQYFAAEYEMKSSTAISTGLAASYFNPPGSDGHYSTAEIKVRYYPNEIPLKGFSLGGAVGVTNVGYTDTQCNGGLCNDVKKSATEPTAAVLLDYNWIMGKHDQFMIGTGVGMKRIFGVSAGDSNISFAYPTFRLMVGWVVH